MEVFSWHNSNSIWYKPTCQFIKLCLMFLGAVIASFLFAAMAASLGALGAFGLVGLTMVIFYLDALAAPYIGLNGIDDDGELLHHLNILKNYQTEPYTELLPVMIGAAGTIIAITTIIYFIICSIYRFFVDIKHHGVYVYQQSSFHKLCILLLAYPFVKGLPFIVKILGCILGVVIIGMLLFFEYLSIGYFDNYTIHNQFVKSDDYLMIFTILPGFIITLITVIFLLKLCIDNFRKDLMESKHDIEADREYTIEKKK